MIEGLPGAGQEKQGIEPNFFIFRPAYSAAWLNIISIVKLLVF